MPYRYQNDDTPPEEGPLCPMFTIAHGSPSHCMEDGCAWWFHNRDDRYSTCILFRIASELTVVAVNSSIY